MRAKYGNDFYTADRPRKHRYVYFCGNRKDARAMRDALRYPVKPYPKGDSRQYDATANVPTQSRLEF